MTDPAQPSRALVGQWAACGIAAAAARFVPAPLLDDVIRGRAVQVAVSRTLHAHGRDYPSARLAPLWAERTGHGFGRYLRAAALRVVLWPIRKYRAIFGAVRGVPQDIARVLLLARTVDRRLARGELTDSDPRQLDAQARNIRRAFDEAMRGMDLRLLNAALADALSRGRGLTSAAAGYARRWFTHPDTRPDLAPGGAVGAGTQQVTDTLYRPEIAELLDQFDARVNTALTAAP